MPEPEPQQNRVELREATLDAIILRTRRSAGHCGYRIVQRIRDRFSNVLQSKTGPLYAALHRVAQLGWVHAEPTRTESTRRARQYRCTAAGRKQQWIEHPGWSR